MPKIHRAVGMLLQGACAAALLLVAGTVQAQDEQRPPGWLGTYLTRSPAGTIIDSVIPGGPAQKAGLVAGDTILKFNGVDARQDLEGDSLRRLLIPGRRITMQLRRNGAMRSKTVVIAKRPSDDQPDDDRQFPSGWLGATLLRGPSGTIIVSVVPDAPAQKAGLVAGDTILKFNGVDARQDLEGDSLRRLLIPGRRITMQLRRNGAMRSKTVVIAKRPQPGLDVVSGRLQMQMQQMQALDSVITGQLSITLGPDSADCKSATNITVRSEPPLVSMFSLGGDGASGGIIRFAGASLAPVTGDLADALHVPSEGMFVVSVGAATPARKAGLKGGDVILEVDSTQTATPDVFVKLLSKKRGRDSSGQRVQFNIVRKGQTRRITLRW